MKLLSKRPFSEEIGLRLKDICKELLSLPLSDEFKERPSL